MRLKTAATLVTVATGLTACGDETTPVDAADDVAADVVDASPDAADAQVDSEVPDVEPDAGSDAPPDTAPSRCWDDLAPGETEVFYDGFPTGPGGGSEGIAFGADGNLVVTSQGRLHAFSADGLPAVLADVPSALGLAPVDDGFIVASIGESTAPGTPDGAVYHVSLGGEVTLWADGIDSPNFVLALPDGSALISDDFDTRVFRVTPDGDVSTAIADVPSPNGMAYGPGRDVMYVASTFTPRGELTRYQVGADGLPDEASATVIAELGAGSTPDGIAVDVDGAIYVAANIQNRIVRVDADTGEQTTVADGLGTPASLAFGAADGFDPCSIYMTQLFGGQVLRVAVGVEGAPVR